MSITVLKRRATAGAVLAVSLAAVAGGVIAAPSAQPCGQIVP